ncbi:molybdopterin-dependent oxidoreductase [Enterobacter asburiae]|uniref:molybdopterin-dependent oxidoreductase n=1 Tax=Enterobacter asburiae TaxID=61645 RepID=UPI003F42DF15
MGKLLIVVFSLLYTFNSYAENGDIVITTKNKYATKPVSYTINRNEFNSLQTKSITTKTPWTPNGRAVTFSGVPIREIMRHVGVSGSMLIMHALNDYEVSIPIEDVFKYDIILANKMDGEYLTLRNFGPYFVIYPVDQFYGQLNTPKFLARLIWQVDKITVVK